MDSLDKVSPGIIVQSATETDLLGDKNQPSKPSRLSSHSSSVIYNDEEENNTSHLPSHSKKRRSTNKTDSTSNRSFVSVLYPDDERSSTPIVSSRSFINEATDENDFEALKEGLNFALGTSNEDPKWFPVSSETRSSPKKGSTSNENLTQDLASNNAGETYIDNIPLRNLNMVGKESYISKDSSYLSPFNDPFQFQAPKEMPTRDPTTPVTDHSLQYHDSVSADHLESGVVSSNINKSSTYKEPPSSPAKLSHMLNKLSDRIAGAGMPASNNDTSTKSSNILGLSENKSSKINTSIRSPLSGKFSLFKDHDVDNHTVNGSINDTHIFLDYAISNENNNTIDSETKENRSFVSTGLGLYLHNDTFPNKDRAYTDNEPDQLQAMSSSQLPIIHQFKPQDHATSPITPHNKSPNDASTSVETMYLFGNSLKIFPPESKLRQICHKIISHHSTNSVLLCLLIIQISLLTYRQWDPLALDGYFYSGYNWKDYILIVINVIYTLEIYAKIIAYGFINDHIMFEELGLPYPESEIVKIYFNSNHILGFLSNFYSNNFFPIKRRSKKPKYKKFKNDTVSISEYDNGNSSEDIDIKEINLDESGNERSNMYNPFNPSYTYNQTFDLKKKYRDLKSHHTKKVTLQDESSDDDEDKVGLVDEPVLNSQRFDKKNTLLLPKSTKNLAELRLKRAYIRNNWHRIDFVSMVTFWISLFLSIDRYDAKHHIMLFRALSCLRILRLCNLTTGTTTILTACKVAIPQLMDVSIFIFCFWLFFGIIGVQSFKSSLTRQCVWYNPSDPNDVYVNQDQHCGSYLSLDGKAMPYILRDGSPSATIKGYRCPKYSKCVSGDNPYGGTVSFDNILQSLEMVFVVMSANTFTDIMYDTMDSDNMGACLFFMLGIFILTVWLINIFIAVIVASFNITRMEAAEEKKKQKQDSNFFKHFGLANQDVSMHTEQINLLKKQNVLLKLYYRFEFIFVFMIMVDLFVQGFRSDDMEDARRHILYTFELAFTLVFLVEIILRFIFYFPNWRSFFISKRNIFDLFLALVTTIIIINPIKEKLGHAYYWLTVFQIMRFYRVVLAVRITRKLWLKIMGNFRALFDLALFYFILTFLVSIILSRYFEGVIPQDVVDEVDFPMHTLPNSFIALYVITSTENWTDILYHLQQYSTTTSSRAFGAVFLIGWFIISNMIILNIFIALIAKTLEVSEEGKRKQQLLQFIDNMIERLQNFDSESSLLSKLKNKMFKKRGLNDELEKAVVNLLLSGTAVNDFLDTDINNSLDEDENVKHLPTSSWKRWLHINFWRTNNYLRNPFYSNNRNKKHEITNFDPAHFAKDMIAERNSLLSKQNKFLQENPKFNNVFYVMGPRHRLRRLCQKLVKSSYGERIDGVEPNRTISEAYMIIIFLATIGLVVTACYLTPLYRKEMASLYGRINWTFYLEVSFNILFTVDFIIKIIADGLIFTPNAYMRSSWNLIDLCVLTSLWIELLAFLKDDGNLSRIVRGLKALRALRLLTISETAKNNFHNTIISGFWKIINAAMISLCLLFPFSIWGLNIFNGRLGYCLDGISYQEECFNEFQNNVFNWDITSPNVYTNPQLEFNRFGSSFATLFEIVSLEGWSDLLLDVMKSTGVGTPPEDNATPFNGVFVILFNFSSTVFILTMFVSVIISNYSKTTGRAYMTTDQISWYHVKKFLLQVKPSKRKDFNQLNWSRKFCYKMTVEKNHYWEKLLTFVLFMHVLALQLECFPSSDALNVFRMSVYMIASTFILIHTIMLLIGQGFKTFIRYKWNIFNFLVSCGAFLTTVIGFSVDQGSVFININKLFLVGILAFIIPRSNRLSQLLRFASASLPTLFSLFFTWIIVFLVYAIAMNQIFGLTKVGPNSSGNINLRSVSKALIVLFRCSFGEGWNYIMEDFTLESPFCSTGTSLDDSDCGNKQYAYILFISWNIISMYIFLNMFVSLILDSFSYINHSSAYSHLIKREEVRKFKRTWQKFDPEGTGYIKPYDLPKLLHSLDGAFSFHFYSGILEIPELCRKWIKLNNPNDPYDISLNYEAIEETLDAMDIPKIRERRKAYERFIEEAIMTMELNNDPGISFTRILLQLPLYTSFDAGQCLNLIDFLERRLLIQKVEKRLHTKRVYETIAAYACRWKYKKNQRQGIRDPNIEFDNELKRRSYFATKNLGTNAPSIFITESNDQSKLDKNNIDEDKISENISIKSSEYLNDEINAENEGSASGVYVPKSPLHIYKARTKSSPSYNISKPDKSKHPKLYIQIPNKPPTNLSNDSVFNDDVNISPFLDSEAISNHESENNVSLIDLAIIGETLESSSWGDALRYVKNNN